MAWKNLEQTTLVDAMMIEHATIKELDDVHELIDWFRVKTYFLAYMPVNVAKSHGHRYCCLKLILESRIQCPYCGHVETETKTPVSISMIASLVVSFVLTVRLTIQLNHNCCGSA